MSDGYEAFVTFWEQYPRKTARVVAARAFDKAIRKVTIDAMLAALRVQRQSEQWQRGVIPHASTWLNQERWTDGPSPVALNDAQRRVVASLPAQPNPAPSENIRALRARLDEEWRGL